MSDDRYDAYIVVTNDGVLFRCHVERTRGDLGPETDIWIFTRGDGLRFVGPRATPIATVDEMRELVERWWQDRKQGPYANTTAETMRAKLRDQDN